jgi:predicted patatin/cPLA2 family phospholipase
MAADKFCITAHGGGMSACYHAGVIAALKEKFGFKKLSRVIATSGAAATYSYLISGQDHILRPTWIELVRSRRFIKLWKFPPGKRVIDLDYLIDGVIKDRNALDLRALKGSPVKFEIGVTDVKTGEPLFFSKDSPVDFFEVLRASCCVPYFARNDVTLNGRSYCDGMVGSVSGLERTADEENVLLILTRPPKPLRKLHLLRKISSWLLLRDQTPELQKAIWNTVARYNDIPRYVQELRQRKNIAVIQPKRDLPALRLDTRADRVLRTIKQGYNDTIGHEELDGFFARIA